MKKKLFIIEDHPLFRTGIIHLLSTEEDLEICGEAESRQEALSLLAKNFNPDLVLLDLSLKDSNGLELLKDIHYSNPDLPILVLSMHDEQFYAQRVINAGGRGYVMKQEAAQNILKAIKTVLSGGIYLSPVLQDRLSSTRTSRVSPVNQLHSLSDREMEIFELTGRGFGTKKMAESLNLSVKTVETHKEHIQKKLNLSGSAELRRFAIEWRNGLRVL
jgi:DNA-binding NarL/FixJ family response regulator